MSTVALAIEPTSLVRQLDAERYSSGAGSDQELIGNRARQMHETLVDSLALTYRDAVLSATFRDLAEQWRTATRFESSLSEITRHPAYQAVIAIGDEVVPLLLAELRRRPEPWFTALKAITGVDPVKPEQRGDMRAMTDTWLRWGREHRLIR